MKLAATKPFLMSPSSLPAEQAVPQKCRHRDLFLSLRVALALLVVAVAAGASAQSVTLVPNAAKFAGTGGAGGYNGDFGAAGSLELNNPTAVYFDTAGNAYLNDKNNNCVRRVDTSGSSTVLAGLVSPGANDTCNTATNNAPTSAQGLLSPSGVVVDSANDVYISDSGHNCVRELTAGSAPGTQQLVAAVGSCGVASTASVVPAPAGMAIDAANNLYIAIRDTADGIFQVVRHARGAAANTVCLVAGTPSALVATRCDGATSNVSLNQPDALALDPAGLLYISDTLDNCVRSYANNQFFDAVGTCAASAGTPTAGSAYSIANPRGVALSQAGDLLFVTSSPSRVWRFTPGTGALLQVAGNSDGSAGAYSTTQNGLAAPNVPLNAPLGIAVDTQNNTYVADSGNNVIRELSPGTFFPSTSTGSSSGTNLLTFQINAAATLSASAGTDYTILPGQNTCSGAVAPAAPGAEPNFCSMSVVFTPSRPGRRYAPVTILDTSTTPAGKVTAGLQGTGVGPQGLLFQGIASTFATGTNSSIDLASDAAGDIYLLEQGSGGNADIREYPVAGGGTSVVTTSSLGVTTATALAGDAAGNWYVADASTNSVVRANTNGTVQANYITGLTNPAALYVDGFGNSLLGENGTRKDVLLVYAGGQRRTIAGGGTATPAEGVPATSVALQSVTAVTEGPDGTVYFGDGAGHYVYRVDSTGTLHVLAGNGTSANTAGGTALGQGLGNVTNLDVDPAGDLVITDPANNKVVEVFASSSTSNLARIFGLQTGAPGNSGDGGTSNLAALNTPVAVTVTGSGAIYVADRGNSSIRSITYPNYPAGAPLNFGSQAVGSVTTLAQTVFNEGNAPLNRSTDPVVSNAAFTNNSTQTTCGPSIQAGSQCNFGFSFTPASFGAQTGTASINDSDPNTPQIVGLTGQAVPAAITGFTAPPEAESFGGPYTGTVVVTTNGGTVPNGTLTFTINGTVVCTVTGNIIGTVTCTLPGGTGLGVPNSPYPVAVTFTGNYPNQTANTSLTEQPRPLNETVDNKTRAYLQPNPTFTGVPNGMIAGVGTDSFVVTYSSPAAQTSVPGSYPITAAITPGAGTNPANYTITNTPGTLTVTTAALTTFTTAGSPETEVYGGIYNGTVTYSTTGTLPTGTLTFAVNGKTVCSTPVTGATSTTCTTPAGTGLPMGTYTVNIAYSGDANYAAASTTASLTVTKAALTVTVNSQTKAFGAAVPALTGVVSGLVNGDTVGGTITVAYSTTVTATTPAGTYPASITAAVAGTAAGNYTVTVTPGNFTVTLVGTTLKLTTSGTPAQAGTSVTFTAVVSATNSAAVPNGPVVFLSDGVVLGTVNADATGTATLSTAALAAGNHTITANYAGNGNFGASTASLTQAIALPTGSFVVSATPQTQLIRGAGQTVYTITVTSMNGFSGPVALTCAGLPADATCAFGAATVTLTANGTQTTTMSTTTTLNDASVSVDRLRQAFPSLRPQGAGGNGAAAGLLVSAAAAFPLQLGSLGFLAAGWRRRRQMGPRFRLLLLLAISAGLLGLAGCGCPNTAFNAYPITVTGTSTFGGPAASSTVVYLYVGQPAYN